jgi:hypothetical protein
MKNEFVYHPPTGEQLAKYTELREKCACLMAFCSPSINLPVAYAAVNSAAEDFHGTIARLAPDCADKTVALRQVRLARMWANEALSTWSEHGFRRALDCALEARMWACAAIALADD